jgi:DNA ligase-1
MLAQEYTANKHKIKFPWYVSPKLDGLRMLASLDNNTLVLYSRGKKRRDNLPHLRTAIMTIMNAIAVPITVDGEIYTHGMPFCEIQSLAQTGRVATKHPVNGAILDAASQLQYWIFDVLYHDEPKLSFYDRWKKFVQTVQSLGSIPGIHLVGTEPVESEEEVTLYHQNMTTHGFEGIMLRNPSAAYVQGRTPHLLKLKDFVSDEGTVINVIQGNGTQEGVAYLVVRDRYGNIFNCNAATTLDIKRQWFLHPDLVVGRIVTFKFQEYLKESHVPRFPVVIAFRDE